MAAIFISCNSQDDAVARGLEKRLADKGHRITLPIGTAIAGSWRTKITKALSSSEALVAILSQAGLDSKNVIGEIGAGRVLAFTKGMLLLPVLVGRIDIPDFINDVFCFRCDTGSDADLDNLVQQLDKAIADNVRSTPRVFISHRHKDEPVAAALTQLLEQAFYIERTDIRCTSVKPYNLSPGERTSEQLRADIAGAELVIGILSPDTSQSNYVLCELGASWGQDVPTFPVLARGATFNDIPSPLNERHSVSLDDEESCLQLIDYIASKTTLKRREGTIGRIAEQAKALVAASRTSRAQSTSSAA